MEKQVIHFEGSSTETIQLNSNIGHGMYHVKIITPENQVKVIKITK